MFVNSYVRHKTLYKNKTETKDETETGVLIFNFWIKPLFAIFSLNCQQCYQEIIEIHVTNKYTAVIIVNAWLILSV